MKWGVIAYQNHLVNNWVELKEWRCKALKYLKIYNIRNMNKTIYLPKQEKHDIKKLLK